MTVVDPFTHKPIAKIRNPRIKIKGFKNGNGSNCFDLQRFMRENHADFGFDENEPIVEAEKRNPWDYMCDILLPKGNRTTLWLCI